MGEGDRRDPAAMRAQDPDLPLRKAVRMRSDDRTGEQSLDFGLAEMSQRELDRTAEHMGLDRDAMAVRDLAHQSCVGQHDRSVGGIGQSMRLAPVHDVTPEKIGRSQCDADAAATRPVPTADHRTGHRERLGFGEWPRRPSRAIRETAGERQRQMRKDRIGRSDGDHQR